MSEVETLNAAADALDGTQVILHRGIDEDGSFDGALLGALLREAAESWRLGVDFSTEAHTVALAILGRAQ